jgi:hypothetical protein
MNRIKIINIIFKQTNFKNYLEIGCRTGGSFLPINAHNKIAVDPEFKIPFQLKVKWILKNPFNLLNKYFSVDSDMFFSQEKKYLKKIGNIDVVLVDGLHTFKTSLNDVLNSLQYLNKDGIIIMHDCFPKHELAALPLNIYGSIDAMKKIEGWGGDWNGDVWKTIVYLRRMLSAYLEICVLDSDHGLGIIRPKINFDKKQLLIDETVFLEIDKLSYKDLVKDTKSMINLRNSDYVFNIIEEIVSQNLLKNE